MNKTEFKKAVTAYLNTNRGQIILKKYQIACEVTPKNIYVEEIDFVERYKEESFVLFLCLSFLFKNGFSIVNIYEDIPELSAFYPWLKGFNFSFPNNLSHSSFPNILKNWLVDFFGVISQRRYGEYYTPVELIHLMFKSMVFNIKDKVVDPSCGSGYFLYAYIEKLNDSSQLKRREDLDTLKDNLYGYDIFPFPIIITKLLIGHTVAKIFQIKKGVFNFKNIKVKNTLHSLECKSQENEKNNFDIIMGNPPFFRIDPNNDNKICSCVSYGHNYSHSLFLHWSIQYLSRRGRLCLLLPQSILSGYYYRKLREQLLKECSLDLIIINKEHEDTFLVQQDVMILIASKASFTKSYFEVGTSSSDFSSVKKFRLPVELTKNKLSIIPVFKSDLQYSVLKRLAKSKVVPHLGDLKLATGNFVWNQNKDFCFEKPPVNSYPLINGPNVTLTGIQLKAKKSKSLSYCLPQNKRYVKKGLAILCRRMSPIGNSHRMVAAIIGNEIANEYVVENHVNIITNGNDLKKVREVLEFLISPEFNTLINACCHTNQVSTNELKILFELLQTTRLNQKNAI